MKYLGNTINVLFRKLLKYKSLFTILLSVLSLIVASIGVYYTYKQATDTRVIELLNDYKKSFNSFVSVDVPDSIIQKYPIALRAHKVQEKIKLINQYVDVIDLGNLRENSSDYTYILSTLEAIKNIINKESEIRNDWTTLVFSTIAASPKNTVVNAFSLKQKDHYDSSYTVFRTLLEEQSPKIYKYIDNNNKEKAKKLLYDVLDSNEFYSFINETKNFNQNIFNYSNAIISEYAVNGKL